MYNINHFNLLYVEMIDALYFCSFMPAYLCRAWTVLVSLALV